MVIERIDAFGCYADYYWVIIDGRRWAKLIFSRAVLKDKFEPDACPNAFMLEKSDHRYRWAWSRRDYRKS